MANQSDDKWLIVGNGHYVTGHVESNEENDKGPGVVLLTVADQKRLGNVGEILVAGTNGTKFSGIREHVQREFSKYRGMPTDFLSFPDDTVQKDEKAYLKAMDRLNPGDGVIIFTPDDTHYEIAQAAIERKLHVLLTKPPVKTLEDHVRLIEAAKRNNVLVGVELHKQFDKQYADARHKIRNAGSFVNFNSRHSQPYTQLGIFSSWLQRGASDISYYLNSHHVGYHVLAMEKIARPIQVKAYASNGIARSMGFDTEDIITLMVQWQNLSNADRTGTATYTAGWVDLPGAEAYSRQGFSCQMENGHFEIDQTHRGYLHVSKDGAKSPNPAFFNYSPDDAGFFDGRGCYGYESIARFMELARGVRQGSTNLEDAVRRYPSIQRTLQLTAILEAGRISLVSGKEVKIGYDAEKSTEPSDLEIV
ncbi:Gfo/Idh/MocA family oxidoreductase [Candidatus Woesearchaeota archaeon]|nr:Gfo/Idh/MocA family oxidoreductase [Candidatus Woesearchaeota archaeon]